MFQEDPHINSKTIKKKMGDTRYKRQKCYYPIIKALDNPYFYLSPIRTIIINKGIPAGYPLVYLALRASGIKWRDPICRRTVAADGAGTANLISRFASKHPAIRAT